MFPEGSETKCRKEIKKQPLTLTIRIASGVHSAMEDTHCAIAKRMRLPIPPPSATKRYLLIKRVSYGAAKIFRDNLASNAFCEARFRRFFPKSRNVVP